MKEDVESRRVRIVQGHNAYADVDVVGGERVFVGSFDGVSPFQLDESDLAYAATFDIVHTGDTGFLYNQVPDIAAGTPVSFDFSDRRGPDYTDPVLPFVSIAWFSASDLDDEQAEELVRRTQPLGPRLVIATRGAAGAIAFDGSRTWRHGAVATIPIDSLGAGDTFIGRFLVEHLGNANAGQALESATAAATATCAVYGAFGHARRYQPWQTNPSEGRDVADQAIEQRTGIS
jgi:sugar/nucleoside kinase (ribokinase family)